MSRSFLLCLLALTMACVVVNPVHGYARVSIVEVTAMSPVKVGDEVVVTAYIHTGNNVRESVDDVQALLVLPEAAHLTSGINPVSIGTMGPGPANAYCNWTVFFIQSGLHDVSVNVTCVDTQLMARWLMNFTTIEVYDFPHAEFSFEDMDPHVNDTVLFNATQSHANAPGGWIISYEWSFGDGETATVNTSAVEHVFNASGSYEVSLRVTDSRGLSNMSLTNIDVHLLGDLNMDRKIDILDVSIVAVHFGSRQGDDRWDPRSDLNKDAVIDILDVTRVAVACGTTG